MKKYISILVILLLVFTVFAQFEGIPEEEPVEEEPSEEEPLEGEPSEEEEEAGVIGPEHGFLHALDIVADNIAAFLSRIGGEETHANVVRRIVAERRAEHLRLLRLKKEGEITSQEFAKSVSSLNKQISKKEKQLGEEETTEDSKAAGKSSGKGKGKK